MGLYFSCKALTQRKLQGIEDAGEQLIIHRRHPSAVFLRCLLVKSRVADSRFLATGGQVVGEDLGGGDGVEAAAFLQAGVLAGDA